MNRKTFYDRTTGRDTHLKWFINGQPNYCFAENKKLYNRTTGFEVKQVLKGGYTRGYNLKGKFYSLKKLRPLLRKI